MLVATFFSPELQGFYYTFLGLLTLQTFAELGFGELLQQSVRESPRRSLEPLVKSCRIGLASEPGAISLEKRRWSAIRCPAHSRRSRRSIA